MSSDLRKSLESIQSLLSQVKQASSSHNFSSPQNDEQQNQNIIRRFNEQHQIHINEKQGHSLQSNSQSEQKSPAVSFQLHSFISPSSINSGTTPATQGTHSTVPAFQRSLINNMRNSTIMSFNKFAEDHAERKETSATSGSLCDFSNATPYKIDIGSQGLRPFSSDEHGGVIGSPLSAFSAVNGSNNDEAKNNRNGRRNLNEDLSVHGSVCSTLTETGGGKRRETSLLVSPLCDTNDETTPSMVREKTSLSCHSKTLSNLSKIRTDLYQSNPNTSSRDPTPYHYKYNPMSSPHGESANHSLHSGGTNLSNDNSRSGLDPPAKSPFLSGSSAQAQFQPTPNHKHYNEEQDLSIIEEDQYSESNILNQSQTSTVTGFTLPRTPVLRKAHNTSHTSHPINSTPLCSTEKLLRRPSLAMRDSFQQLATQTAHQLETTWDLVGVLPEERAMQLADLVEKIAAICDEKVAEEQGLADQFRKEIESARNELEDICNALRIEEIDPVASLKRDPSATGMCGVGNTLQSEYEAIMARLENIRALKAEAQGEIITFQKRIHETYSLLNSCTLDEAAQCEELESWRDTSTNLTEERRSSFRKKALDLEESVKSRTNAVISLILECQNLIRDLEIVPLECMENYIHCTPGAVKVGKYDDDVKIMMGLQCLSDTDTDMHQQVPRGKRRPASSYTIATLNESEHCIGIGKDALERLTNRIAELNGEKRRRRAKLAEMGVAIASLWSMLRIPEEDQKAFTESIRGFGMDTIQKGEIELIRLHELKAVTIGKLIRDQRKVIEDLWEKTNASDLEKASFDAYFHIYDDEKFTDDLLAKHEEYARSLNTKLKRMQPILDLIEKRESVLSDRFELEILQKDPDRLKGRGASKQLMKEEKMTRRVQKELPKITSILERALQEWYQENRPVCDGEDVSDPSLGHFLYQGAPYIETIHKQENDWRNRKEQEELERQRKRHEERSTVSNNAFGTSYSKLPGKKWNPSIGSTTSSSSQATKKSAESVENNFRQRSASATRQRPLADISSKRQNIRPASSQQRSNREKVVSSESSESGNKKVSEYRAVSAPRPRM